MKPATDIQIQKIEECWDSPYIRPHRIFYTQNGAPRTWDIVQAHNSVSVLIYDTSLNALILVKQMRPALFVKSQIPCVYELCAGIVDKDKSLAQIASEEVFEECGYDVPASELVEICSFYSSVGFAASKQHCYYAEVNAAHKTGQGGGIDTEQIEVIALPLSEIRDFVYDSSRAKTSGLLFACMWFLNEKAPYLPKA